MNQFIAQNSKVPLRLRPSELSTASWSHLATEVGADLLPPYDTVHPVHHDKSTPYDQGVTVWSCALASSSEADGTNKRSALIAWDWVLIGAGVIARCNVQQVATNIEWVGDDDRPIQPAMRPLVFATLIHGLPWQAQVLREIETHGAAAA